MFSRGLAGFLVIVTSCILCLDLVSCGIAAGRLGSKNQCVLLFPSLLSLLLQIMASTALIVEILDKQETDVAFGHA